MIFIQKYHYPEDATELAMVKSSLIILIKKHPKEALAGLFSQVMGEDDLTREKCIEFVCNSVMKIKNELFAKNFDNEQFFIEQIKQVLYNCYIISIYIKCCYVLRTCLPKAGKSKIRLFKM